MRARPRGFLLCLCFVSVLVSGLVSAMVPGSVDTMNTAEVAEATDAVDAADAARATDAAGAMNAADVTSRVNMMNAAHLANTVSGVEDGRLRFSFATRPGVYGDGHNLIIHHDVADPDWDFGCDCSAGPARVMLRVHHGQVSRLKNRVGGKWHSALDDTIDLGEIAPAAAADYLLTLAERGDEEVAEDAVAAATLARDFDEWKRVLRLARDRSRGSDVRQAAIFWLAQHDDDPRVLDLFEKILLDR